MARARYSADEILGQMDDAAGRYKFPMLDNAYVALADVRLSAFRDDRRWAVVIEVLGCNTRQPLPEAFEVALYRFGNCLRGEPGLSNDDFVFPVTWEDEGEDDPDWWEVPPELKEMQVRGQRITVPRDPALYEAKGIDVEDVDHLHGDELLRALVPEHRDLLLATEQELRRRLPANLPLFDRRDAWHHPNVADDELPSGNETFRKLAEALAEGDPNRMRLRRKPNTHWKNWPEGGTC
jgi:hypothetical protein